MTVSANHLIQTFLASGTLPLARSISQVQAMLQRADYNACDLAEHLKLDPTLATQVMAVANSAFFARSPCAGIEEAVNRLGTAQLTRIFSQVLANATLMRPLRAYGLAADTIWRRSVFAAVGAEMAAARVDEDRSSAYMIGLLHRVGMLVVESQWARQPAALRFNPTGFEQEFSADERKLGGSDQAALGAELLRQLRFPASVAEAVGRQYARPATPMEGALYLGRLARACVHETPPREPDAAVLRRFDLVATSQLEDFCACVQEETQKLVNLAA